MLDGADLALVYETGATVLWTYWLRTDTSRRSFYFFITKWKKEPIHLDLRKCKIYILFKIKKKQILVQCWEVYNFPANAIS